MTKHQAPTAKLQSSTKAPAPKPTPRHGHAFEVSRFSGAWCLKFGASGIRAATIVRPVVFLLLAILTLSLASARAQIRDGGVDPRNLGKGIWIFSMVDATNKLGGHIPGVTNENSLMLHFKSVGIRHMIVKAATSITLFGDCKPGPQFTSNLVNTAHANGIQIFGYNRSFGSNIVGEVAVADYVFNQGADGFVYDAEAEWESGNAWITNGPAQAWQLCSTVRSNWPNKFIAHAPFPIIYLHASFPYKEFGFWCDAVMPQIYHFSSSGIKNSPSAAINWSDVNWATWQNSLAALPATNINGVPVNWTNAIKPIIPLRDVYGEVVAGGIICESAASTVYSDKDVMEFTDYIAADPHAQTAGGYQGVNYWRADTTGTNQWANIANSTSGNFSNIVRNIVLDDIRATVTGGWTAVKVFSATTTSPTYTGATGTDTNSFGTNYWSNTQGTGAEWMEFTPNIVIPGNYDVFQWHAGVSNASSGTPFMIRDVTGTNTVFANQQTNAGNWSWLGRFNFASGTNGFIRVLDNFSDVGNLALVDGLKLTYANDDVVLDNTNSEVNFSAGWALGTTAAGRYQADYQFATSSNGGPSTATYVPNFPNLGFYDVSVWYPASANRASNAPFRINFLNGTTNILVNQQLNGGFWFKIASALPFNAGTNGSLQISNNAGPSVVIADAAKFSFVAPLVVPVIQSVTQPATSAVQLTVSSTPGYPVWLDRTTNFSSWQPWTNQLSTNGTTIFTDPNATNDANFYRARQ